jgi:hypothetical protein
MNLAEIKTFVRSILTESEIRAFGLDLRQRDSWEVLADRCKEYAAAAQDMAQESAEVVQEIATPIAQKLWDAATSETAQRIYRGVLMAIVLTFVVIGIGLTRAIKHYSRVAHGQLLIELPKLPQRLHQFRFRVFEIKTYIVETSQMIWVNRSRSVDPLAAFLSLGRTAKAEAITETSEG